LKYPSSIDCDGIQSLFETGEGDAKKLDLEEFKSYAEYDKDET